MTGGELFERLVNSGPYSEADAARHIRTILSALQWLHAKRIIHSDLKPENLLLTSTAPGATVKVRSGLPASAVAPTPTHPHPRAARRAPPTAGRFRARQAPPHDGKAAHRVRDVGVLRAGGADRRGVRHAGRHLVGRRHHVRRPERQPPLRPNVRLLGAPDQDGNQGGGLGLRQSGSGSRPLREFSSPAPPHASRSRSTGPRCRPMLASSSPSFSSRTRPCG